MFDRDGSGKVSSTELRQVLTKSGQMKLTDEEVDEMVEGVDEMEDRINPQVKNKMTDYRTMME